MAAARADYAAIAGNMKQRFDRAEGPSAFSDAFLVPQNLAPHLAYIANSGQERHSQHRVAVDWGTIFNMVREFARMDHVDPAASARQFATIADANLLFRNAMADPFLTYDQYLWQWQFELAEKRYKGIDQSMYRMYARNPTAAPRGLPPMKGRENKGVGAMQPSTGTYVLSHPFSRGRVRQRGALALSNYAPAPDVSCAYDFFPGGVEK